MSKFEMATASSTQDNDPDVFNNDTCLNDRKHGRRVSDIVMKNRDLVMFILSFVDPKYDSCIIKNSLQSNFIKK